MLPEAEGGVHLIYADEMWDNDRWMDRALDALGDPVYITFDLDCLDPTIAPGVSNIEPGEKGFDIDEAVGLLFDTQDLFLAHHVDRDVDEIADH